MSLPFDLEAALPLSFSSSSGRSRRILSFCLNPRLPTNTCFRLRKFAILIITASFILVLYLFNQLPISLDTSKITFFSFTTTQDDGNRAVLETLDLLPPLACNVPPTPFFYPQNSSNVYLAFTSTDPVPDNTVRRIPAHDAISNECIEQWVGKGIWTGACLKLRQEESRIDLVWTWVNGSDPLHRAARKAYVSSNSSDIPKTSLATLERQYRQHDELRYSLRSVKAATTGWKNSKFHLVANSYSISPLPSEKEDGVDEEDDEEREELRLGQVPQWLDLRKMVNEVPKLKVHHDANLFRLLPSSPNDVVSDVDIAAWREASLPTFNSMAIESQLANLPTSEVSENTVFLMDDTYLLRPIPTSTFYSPIHGPILHLQPDLLVKPTGPILPSGWSEWRGLQTAASRLSERFGSRGRPYLVHNARSIPLSLLHEASLAFPSAFSGTATSRFRGQDDRKPETHTLWLATHFIVERHREALLWSWVVGKWGGWNGMITRGEKVKMWLELGGSSEEEKRKVVWPRRESRLGVREDLEKAGLPRSTSTNYAFVSSDGYPYTYLPLAKHYPRAPSQDGWPDLAVEPSGDLAPLACTINRVECLDLKTEFELAADMFKRILVDKPSCGDCIISALIAASGSTGISAFLPPRKVEPVSSSSSSTQPSLPVELSSILSFPYPSDPYFFSLRLIQRYSYVLGGTPSRFFGATSAESARSHLAEVDSDPGTVLLCINDDLVSTEPKTVGLLDEVLRKWMDGRWPARLGIERVGEVDEREKRLQEELCV